MRSGGGKSKGASYERVVCKQLSLWVSGGKQEDCYWRSSMSGGRSTVAAKSGKRLAAQAGDISCIHPVGQWLTERFFIEVKAYGDLNFQGLLTGKGHLAHFWQEATKQSETYAKLPMLIAKQNNFPAIICFDRRGMTTLSLVLKPVLVAPPMNLHIVLFEEFLKLKP